jgi:hypothetical protein
MQHGVRGTSIYTIQTATNCHLPNQSAKTARFVHYRDKIVETREPGNDLAFLEVEHKQV